MAQGLTIWDNVRMVRTGKSRDTTRHKQHKIPSAHKIRGDEKGWHKHMAANRIGEACLACGKVGAVWVAQGLTHWDNVRMVHMGESRDTTRHEQHKIPSDTRRWEGVARVHGCTQEW